MAQTFVGWLRHTFGLAPRPTTREVDPRPVWQDVHSVGGSYRVLARPVASWREVPGWAELLATLPEGSRTHSAWLLDALWARGIGPQIADPRITRLLDYRGAPLIWAPARSMPGTPSTLGFFEGAPNAAGARVRVVSGAGPADLEAVLAAPGPPWQVEPVIEALRWIGAVELPTEADVLDMTRPLAEGETTDPFAPAPPGQSWRRIHLGWAPPELRDAWHPPRLEGGAVEAVVFPRPEVFAELDPGAVYRLRFDGALALERICEAKPRCFPVAGSLPIPGRPLLDADGAPRVASCAAPPTSRWRRDGLYEHASVAAFARASLDLMALGAPLELIARHHQAALDEIHHARLCFALDGTSTDAIGPLEAPEPGPVDLGAFAARTFLEGCVGEGRAAREARLEAESVGEGPEREALVAIAEDEARHAELAWDTVAWAASRGGPPVAESLRAVAETLTPDDPARRRLMRLQRPEGDDPRSAPPISAGRGDRARPSLRSARSTRSRGTRW